MRLEISPGYEWLADQASGWQFGERGMLAGLCEKHWITYGVEIGAGDGETLPVTLDFMPRLTLFEIDPERREKLSQKFPDATIGAEFTAEHAATCSDACVVIDVDGQDFPIARMLLGTGVKPKVVCIEHYDRLGPYVGEKEPVDLVPDWMLGMELVLGGFAVQQPWAAMWPWFGEHGYKLAALTRCNSIYVHEG